MVGFKYWHGACQLLLVVFFVGIGVCTALLKGNTQPEWVGLMANHHAENHDFQNQQIQSIDANTTDSSVLPSLNDVVLAVMSTRHMMRDQLQSSPKIRVEHRPEPTPLGALRFADGECVIAVNTNPHAWHKWRVLLQHDASTPLHAVLQTAAAHEMAHCMPIPNMKRAMQQTHASHQFISIAEQELLADVVALLFAAQYHNIYFEAIQNAFIQTRMNLGAQENTHNHGMRLKRIAEKQMFELKHSEEFKTLNWIQMGLMLMNQTTPQT